MSIYIFDTETTDRKEGEIIEAAWSRLALGAWPDRIPPYLPVEELFVQRYKPAKVVTFGAIAVHHILPSELEEFAPSSSFSLPNDAEYLIGHSIDFDWTAAGSPPNVKRIDTHALAQHVWPDATGYSQVALLYMLLGANESTRELVKGAHGAAADVFLNRTLLQHILDVRPAITTWSALHAYSEECRIPLTCPLKRWDGVLLEDMDSSSIGWCLRQDWLDPYFRIGLERVVEKREAEYRELYAPRSAPAAATADTAQQDNLPF
jgi:exodeoxyribonuclease X